MSSNTSKGPVRGRVEALAQRLTQTVETVTRSSRIFIESSDVDDLNPPDDIEEYHEAYREVGIVRGNINQFVRDVVAPGIRIEAEDDATEAYFSGDFDGSTPDYAPTGGFLDNCAVIGGERNQPFYPYLKTSIAQKYTRGTVLHEYLKPPDDKDDDEFTPQGFKHIRPETVSARTHSNTNILVGPDETDLDLDRDETTKRDEAAAYVQYDDQSIVGNRIGGFEDKDEIPLSQNDVLKQVNDADIGGDSATEEGIFGTSPIEAVSEDIEEYREMKRDLARAIKTKGYGVWTVEFDTEVTEAGEEIILTEWDEGEQDDWMDDVDGLGPGDMLGHDGSITPNKWEPDVPDLEYPLQHLVDDILAALPAPKFATAHGEQVTQHVTGEQSESYQDLVEEERQAQERDWTEAFRLVAERHSDLNPDGLRVHISPPESSNPIAELDDEQIEKMEQFMSALNTGLGKVPIDSVLNLEEFLTTTMDIPEEAFVDADGGGTLDESNPQVQEMADELGMDIAEADD
jgi:hypothetical protein